MYFSLNFIKKSSVSWHLYYKSTLENITESVATLFEKAETKNVGNIYNNVSDSEHNDGITELVENYDQGSNLKDPESACYAEVWIVFICNPLLTALFYFLYCILMLAALFILNCVISSIIVN